MTDRPALRLDAPTLEAPDHLVEQWAALARASMPSAPVQRGRRLATVSAAAAGAVVISVGGAWASGTIDVPGLPSQKQAPADPSPAPVSSSEDAQDSSEGESGTPGRDGSGADDRAASRRGDAAPGRDGATPRQDGRPSRGSGTPDPAGGRDDAGSHRGDAPAHGRDEETRPGRGTEQRRQPDTGSADDPGDRQDGAPGRAEDAPRRDGEARAKGRGADHGTADKGKAGRD